jgi:cytochrome b
MSRQPIIERIHVWDKFVRLHHWSVAGLVLGNGLLLEGGSPSHRYAGYLLAALVCGRIAWGLFGSKHARFCSFLPTPARIRHYLRNYRNGNMPLPSGHNPLGGSMVILMLGLMLALGCSGWLMGTDALWGETWLQQLHATLSSILLYCAGLHVTMVLIHSRHLRINLPKAMITGYKERTALSRPLNRQGSPGRPRCR